MEEAQATDRWGVTEGARWRSGKRLWAVVAVDQILVRIGLDDRAVLEVEAGTESQEVR